MSTAHVWRGEKELSLKELEHAIELNPYFTRAKLALYNRRELANPAVGLEAAEGLRKTLALSPREPDRAFYFWAIARISLVHGQYLEALDWADRALSVQPKNPMNLFRRALCLAALDRVDEAKQMLAECEARSPGFVEKQRDWRPYDKSDFRNDELFSGFRRHGLAGWT
jgi:tetratricopeptide (TPR) repeat protein